MMKSPIDQSQSSSTIQFTTRSNPKYSTRSTRNKTIKDNTEENIKRNTNNKDKYNQNDQDSTQSTNRYASRTFPTTIQWTSSNDSLTSGITLPSFQKRKKIINKVDQFLKRFKLKKRIIRKQEKMNGTKRGKTAMNTMKWKKRKKGKRQ